MRVAVSKEGISTGIMSLHQTVKRPGCGPCSKLWWNCLVEPEFCSHAGPEIWVILVCPLSHPSTRSQTLMSLAHRPGSHWCKNTNTTDYVNVKVGSPNTSAWRSPRWFTRGSVWLFRHSQHMESHYALTPWGQNILTGQIIHLELKLAWQLVFQMRKV